MTTPATREEVVELRARALHRAFNTTGAADYTYPWGHELASCDHFRLLARATLEADDAAGITLVPVEATEVQQRAGQHAVLGDNASWSIDSSEHVELDAYRAMLAASPYKKEPTAPPFPLQTIMQHVRAAISELEQRP